MSAIIDRQNDVRHWWRAHRFNPPFLVLSAARWGAIDLVERWMDMQARVACKDHGQLLNHDLRWGVIQNQMLYPPLWLVHNWHTAAVQKVKKKMLTQYQVLNRTEAGKLILSDSLNLFPTGIAATDAEIYSWLGLVGGERHAITPPRRVPE